MLASWANRLEGGGHHVAQTLFLYGGNCRFGNFAYRIRRARPWGTDTSINIATRMVTFTGTKTMIGTGVVSIGMRPYAVVGGVVGGTAMVKVAAGDGHLVATFGFAASSK